MAHYPVLLSEVLEYLQVDPTGIYVDCTLGEGGYAEAILSRLTQGRLIAIDRDLESIEAARKRLHPFANKTEFVHGSFGDIHRILGAAQPVSGIVADLGLSRRQIESRERGFSFQWEGPLDMRMDQSQSLTAAEIVNHYGERQLADLIFQFGEERRSRRIARAIVRGRPIRSTAHLAQVVKRAAPRALRQKIHPATRTFQALRIAVNHELEELERLLDDAPLLLRTGGRFVVVSFHSLEDRLVKHSFRRWAAQDVLTLLTRKVVRPAAEEIAENPASRSAKLRASERTAIEWQHRN